jgi:hypothetical protein
VSKLNGVGTFLKTAKLPGECPTKVYIIAHEQERERAGQPRTPDDLMRLDHPGELRWSVV